MATIPTEIVLLACEGCGAVVLPMFDTDVEPGTLSCDGRPGVPHAPTDLRPVTYRRVDG